MDGADIIIALVWIAFIYFYLFMLVYALKGMWLKIYKTKWWKEYSESDEYHRYQETTFYKVWHAIHVPIKRHTDKVMKMADELEEQDRRNGRLRRRY